MFKNKNPQHKDHSFLFRTEAFLVQLLSRNKAAVVLALIILFFVGLTLRINGLFDNHPFWVDEFSSANEARLFIKHGVSALLNPNLNIEYNHILDYTLIAISFKLFGQHEWVARLPFVLIGSLVPIVVFYVARYLFNTHTAVAAALFTTFSYIEIAWSRQARGYVSLQFFVLITLYLYLRITTEKENSRATYLLFFISLLLGALTHFSFFLLAIAIAVHFVLISYKSAIKFIKNKHIYIVASLLITILFITGIIHNSLQFIRNNTALVNNAWYYHSFLWREYGLIAFLALLGIIGPLYKKWKEVSVFVLYMLLHVGFFTFVFAPYSSRYLLAIFPLLFIFTAFSIVKFTNAIITVNKFGLKQTQMAFVGTLLLTLFIIGNGHKFVTKPHSLYSVNHDFREIALLDYNQVYNIIKSKGELQKGKTAVIDTWLDRLYWYLGPEYYAPYMFRWGSYSGKTNGLNKMTKYTTNDQGEKLIPRQTRLILISDLPDLKKAINKYPKGFIFIDDSTMPRDVIVYAEKNFKKELYLDHYPLDDNPYSIWPATLYSWGI